MATLLVPFATGAGRPSIIKIDNEINWKFGLIMALGNMIGALVASRMAVKKGVVFVKWVIIIVVLMTSAQMFGIYDFKDLFLPLVSQPAVH